jgi:hypothetical protein
MRGDNCKENPARDIWHRALRIKDNKLHTLVLDARLDRLTDSPWELCGPATP